MELQNGAHLSYCTNIHAGESWSVVFESLKEYCLPLKATLSPDRRFGIGLRLSNESSVVLAESAHLQEFKQWLADHDLYVFTMNGFPYGAFHFEVVKDKVHQPDWTTRERLEYSKRLFDILAELLPTGLDGGVSTSPLSYKFWHKTQRALEQAKLDSCQNMIKLAAHLVRLKEKYGKSLHLDIEPEPDGILEDSTGFIHFYKEYLLKQGKVLLASELGCTPSQAELHIREHLQLCFDVCHFAVGFESPAVVIEALEAEGIRTGKIQISAALKAILPPVPSLRQQIKDELSPFNESTYLHQVTMQGQDGNLAYYPDLADGLTQLDDMKWQELRTHFHVPIFAEDYGLLESTQDEIVKTLGLWKRAPFTQHLEIETYTWEVLPSDLKLDLRDSIEREMRWVLSQVQ